MKIPKTGTRVRAVIDCLYLAKPDDVVKWSDLRDAYGAATGPLPPLRTRSRQYIGMSMAPILRQYATKVMRGRYQLKLGVRAELDAINPEPLGYPSCKCGAHTWEHLINHPELDGILQRVRHQLRSEGYFGHWVNKPCVEDEYTERAKLKRLEKLGAVVIAEVKKEPVFTENIDAVLKNMGKVGQVMLNEQELDDDKCNDPECPLCDPTPVKPTQDFVPLTQVIRHSGLEPDLDDLCGTCGERYGSHFGEEWPAPSDCPRRAPGGSLVREEEKLRFKFWSSKPKWKSSIQGSPEIEDMAWHQKFNEAYDSMNEGRRALDDLKATIKDLREENAALRAAQQDTISQEMHLDALVHKDNEINELVDKVADLERVVKSQLKVIVKRDAALQRVHDALYEQEN